MHFKIIVDGERHIFRDVKTTVKMLRCIEFRRGPQPYEVVTGLSSGEILCDHDLPEGTYEATIEAFETTGHIKVERDITVTEDKILI